MTIIFSKTTYFGTLANWSWRTDTLAKRPAFVTMHYLDTVPMLFRRPAGRKARSTSVFLTTPLSVGPAAIDERYHVTKSEFEPSILIGKFQGSVNMWCNRRVEKNLNTGYSRPLKNYVSFIQKALFIPKL